MAIHPPPEPEALTQYDILQCWFADVPRPVDVQRISPWSRWDRSRHARLFSVQTRDIELAPGNSAVVEVVGVQYDDGTTERAVNWDNVPAEMTPDQARAIAAALIEAAHRIDTGTDT